MRHQRLTARFVASVKPPKTGRATYLDSVVRGFGLRVTDRGHKSWFLVYRFNGPMRRWTFGSYPAMSLVDARATANRGWREISQGTDPAATKAASHRAPTVKQMAHDYMEREAKRKKRTWAKTEQIIKRELLPRFGHRKASSITRREIREAHDTIAARAPVAANRALQIIKRVWGWALENDYPTITVNPCHGVKMVDERRGDRWLRPTEIKAVWSAMDSLPPRWRAFCRLCLLTGQHPGEIITMRKDQVECHGGGAWWVMPEGHHKMDLSHSVYLPALALEAFEAACAATDHPLYPFPSRVGGAPDPANSPWWRWIKTLCSAAKVDHFTARDFRPSVATGMDSEPLAVPQVTIAKILGHANPGITATYVRHGYDAEKRRAMIAWERRIVGISEGDIGGNVVPMPGVA